MHDSLTNKKPRSRSGIEATQATHARTGKIAHLPAEIRRELNTRLADGESGPALLTWLNSLDDVKAILARDFYARPIRTQNLSEWRLGGFQDWLHRQETLDNIRQFVEDSEEFNADIDLHEVPDHFAGYL